MWRTRTSRRDESKSNLRCWSERRIHFSLHLMDLFLSLGTTSSWWCSFTCIPQDEPTTAQREHRYQVLVNIGSAYTIGGVRRGFGETHTWTGRGEQGDNSVRGFQGWRMIWLGDGMWARHETTDMKRHQRVVIWRFGEHEWDSKCLWTMPSAGWRMDWDSSALLASRVPVAMRWPWASWVANELCGIGDAGEDGYRWSGESGRWVMSLAYLDRDDAHVLTATNPKSEPITPKVDGL